MNDIIQGQKFKELTKLHYAPVITKSGYKVPYNFPLYDYRYLKNTLNVSSLRDFDIIYTHSFWADQLFDIIRNIKKYFIVITHNCDTNITIAPPDNVVMWFSQNVNMEHERIRSIPIGLENDFWMKAFPKKELMILLLTEPKVFRNMVYINHNIKNNEPVRNKTYQLLEDKSWVTAKRGESFDKYAENIYNHPFVICPEGNGIDTHRKWECLYLNTIPIEKRNINNKFYKDLPICFVDDWEEITEEFLFNEYKRISELKWDHAKLTFKYWENEIKHYTSLL